MTKNLIATTERTSVSARPRATYQPSAVVMAGFVAPIQGTTVPASADLLGRGVDTRKVALFGPPSWSPPV